MHANVLCFPVHNFKTSKTVTKDQRITINFILVSEIDAAGWILFHRPAFYPLASRVEFTECPDNFTLAYVHYVDPSSVEYQDVGSEIPRAKQILSPTFGSLRRDKYCGWVACYCYQSLPGTGGEADETPFDAGRLCITGIGSTARGFASHARL